MAIYLRNLVVRTLIFSSPWIRGSDFETRTDSRRYCVGSKAQSRADELPRKTATTRQAKPTVSENPCTGDEHAASGARDPKQAHEEAFAGRAQVAWTGSPPKPYNPCRSLPASSTAEARATRGACQRRKLHVYQGVALDLYGPPTNGLSHRWKSPFYPRT